MGVTLFGLEFASGSAADILATAGMTAAGRPRLIVTANMDHIVSLSENAAFRHAYSGAVARTLDGMPLVWLARLKGHKQAHRVTGHDILAAVLASPWTEDRRVFLVCSDDRVGDAATKRLHRAGAEPGSVAFAVPPLGFERDAAYSSWLAAEVKAHGSTLVIMAVGAPKSEIWVDQQGAAMGAPIVAAVGDALSVAAGLQPRAPVFMQRNGLEWLFRFVQNPKRLFHRYFVRSWRFLALIGTELSDGRGDPPPTRRSTAEEAASKI